MHFQLHHLQFSAFIFIFMMLHISYYAPNLFKLYYFYFTVSSGIVCCPFVSRPSLFLQDLHLLSHLTAHTQALTLPINFLFPLYFHIYFVIYYTTSFVLYLCSSFSSTYTTEHSNFISYFRSGTWILQLDHWWWGTTIKCVFHFWIIWLCSLFYPLDLYVVW